MIWVVDPQAIAIWQQCTCEHLLSVACLPGYPLQDAVLANCRTDLFMPNVHLINEGDIVSELYMMIEGEVEVHSAAMRRAHAQAQAREVANQRSLDRGSASTDAGSVNSKSYTPSTVGAQSQATSGMSLLRQNSLAMSAVRTHIDRRSTSECFGEVAFFTEVPSTDSIWTVSVVRLLVLPRQAYTNLVTAYPNQGEAYCSLACLPVLVQSTPWTVGW